MGSALNIMSPYRKLKSCEVRQINAVPLDGECIQPSASVRVNNVEVLPRSTPITQKLKVKPAGIDDFITKSTEKRAPVSKWAKVLPPYKTMPSSSSSINTVSTEEIPAQTQPAKFNFKNQLKNMANVIKATNNFKHKDQQQPKQTSVFHKIMPPKPQEASQLTENQNAQQRKSTENRVVHKHSWYNLKFLDFRLHCAVGQS